MAKESGSDQPTDRLNSEIERSRDRLSREVRGLRYELDIPAKIKRSFQQQTAVWVVGAIVVGAIVVALPRRGKRVYVDVEPGAKKKSRLLETGFLLGALRIAATLLKPAVADFIRNRMGGGGGASARPFRKW